MMAKISERRDRVISVNGDIFAQLTDLQTNLATKFGFVPTMAQVIQHLIGKAD